MSTRGLDNASNDDLFRHVKNVTMDMTSKYTCDSNTQQLSDTLSYHYRNTETAARYPLFFNKSITNASLPSPS